MEKSLKNSFHSSSLSANRLSSTIINAAASFSLVAVLFYGQAVFAQTPKTKPPPAATAPKAVENYKDIIAKAQNLTLQRDRLQASQVLLRAIEREPKNSVAYKELVKALDELTSVFYTERAQAAFIVGEGALETKPKEAIDSFQDALRLEEANVAVLKALARTYLVLDDCDKAEGHLKTAEGLNPISPEILLLRLQTASCAKNSTFLATKIPTLTADLGPLEKYARSIQIKEMINRKEFAAAKALVSKWEAEVPDYPEVYFWKWELSRLAKAPDRAAAVKYTQTCQHLTTRKRKSYILDPDLCKGKAAVDEYLKATSQAEPTEGSSDE